MTSRVLSFQSLYDTAAKIAKTWQPVFEALENHPVEFLAMTPLHDLALSEGHPFLGQLFIDQTGHPFTGALFSKTVRQDPPIAL